MNIFLPYKLKADTKKITEKIMKHHEYVREYQPFTRITNKSSKLLESIYDDLRAREAKGVSEYKCTLDKSTLNELELLEYLYEEVLDQAFYIKALINKKKKK